MQGTEEQIKVAKVILKHRGRKPRSRWSKVWTDVEKVVTEFDYMDFYRLTKTATKNLKGMING